MGSERDFYGITNPILRTIAPQLLERHVVGHHATLHVSVRRRLKLGSHRQNGVETARLRGGGRRRGVRSERHSGGCSLPTTSLACQITQSADRVGSEKGRVVLWIPVASLNALQMGRARDLRVTSHVKRPHRTFACESLQRHAYAWKRKTAHPSCVRCTRQRGP